MGGLIQRIKHALVPGSARAEELYRAALVLTDEVTEVVRLRKYPDPFAPIIRDLRRLRALSEYDQKEVADIYRRHSDETKVIGK